jgi:hypothetical protein
MVARDWSRDPKPIPVGLLQSWLRLAATVDEAPPPPELAATWVELAPTAPIALGPPDELVRFDDWTTLCETLDEHAAEALARFGFPGRYRESIEGLLSAAEAAAADPTALSQTHRELLAAILHRLNRLRATDHGRAAYAAFQLSVPAEPRLPEIYLPPIPAGLREILDSAALKPRSDEALVRSVLRDL